MRPDPLLQFWLGLGAIGLLLFIVFISWTLPGLLDRRLPAVAIFRNVGGLMEGAEVRDGGFIVGRVTQIEPQLKEHRFVVRFRLDPSWTPSSEDGVSIAEPNPFRAAVLSIVRGPDCPEPLSDAALAGLQLRGCGQQTSLIDAAFQAINAAKATIEQANAILALVIPPTGKGPTGAVGLAPLLARLEATLANLEALSAPGNLGAILASTKSTLANVDVLSQAARAAVDDKHQTQYREIIDNLTSTTKNANLALAALNELLSANANPAQAAFADLRSILATTAASMSGIATNMEAASANLKEITDRLRDDPGGALRGRQRSDPSFLAKPRR